MPCLMLIACHESFKYFSKIWAILVGSVLILPVSQLGGLPVAVHFYLKRFLCELSLVLYLSATAAFYEQHCRFFCCARASVLVIACLIFV